MHNGGVHNSAAQLKTTGEMGKKNKEWLDRDKAVFRKDVLAQNISINKVAKWEKLLPITTVRTA